MMGNPIVSVIIPTYNRDKLILKALDSVFKQTFQDFEILVIDDASTDNTEEVIKNLNHEKIRYYKLDKNGGQCIARNYGIKKALGTYIAFLDSDDEWLPEKLQKQVNCFENGDEKLGCVYGYSYKYDAIINETSLIQDTYHRGYIYEELLNGFCPPTPSLFMVKKTAIIEANGFDEKLLTFVDLDMWLRLGKNYHFDFVEEPLIIKYEQIGDQYINNFEKRYKGFGLFFNKWQKEVDKTAGKSGLSALKKELIMALVVPILDYPPANIRWQTFKIFKLLFTVKSMRYRLYIKTLMILLFGPNIISTLRKLKK